MATVVLVMDRDEPQARSDVIVVVDPRAKRLVWIPRDLWCDDLDARVNVAYAAGGDRAARRALEEHGFSPSYSICLWPRAIAAGLTGYRVAVPVRRTEEFWYPLTPQLPIERGRKRIRFNPPVAELAGERIHQWLGARSQVHGAGSDLRRIRRQQELLAVMLGERFPFERFIADGLPVRVSAPQALRELGRVRTSWRLETFGPLVPVTVRGEQVLRHADRR